MTGVTVMTRDDRGRRSATISNIVCDWLGNNSGCDNNASIPGNNVIED